MPRQPLIPASARAARRKEVAKAVLAGMSVSKAAAQWKLSPDHVRRVCRWEGLRFGTGGDVGFLAQSSRRRQEVARQAASGASVKSLAARYRVGLSTVRLACLVHGVEPRRAPPRAYARLLRTRKRLARELGGVPPKFGPPRVRRIAQLLLTTDLTVMQIGTACGVSYQRVQQVLGKLRERMRE